jgi:hypothetical protein
VLVDFPRHRRPLGRLTQSIVIWSYSLPIVLRTFSSSYYYIYRIFAVITFVCAPSTYTLVLAQKSMFSLYKKSSFDQNCVFNTAFESPHPDASNGVFLLINGVLEHFSDNKNQKSKKYLNQAFFVGSERVNETVAAGYYPNTCCGPILVRDARFAISHAMRNRIG